MITRRLAEDLWQRLSCRAGQNDAEVAEGEHDGQEEREAKQSAGSLVNPFQHRTSRGTTYLTPTPATLQSQLCACTLEAR